MEIRADQQRRVVCTLEYMIHASDNYNIRRKASLFGKAIAHAQQSEDYCFCADQSKLRNDLHIILRFDLFVIFLLPSQKVCK